MRHVLRHRKDDRPRTAGGRDGERAPHELGDPRAGLDADELLDCRSQDLELARLLRHVLPRVVAVRVADDGDERDAGVERLDERGHEVRRARSQRRVAHSGATGDPRVRVGGERARPLVLDQVMGQAEPADRVVERQELEAAHPEHRAGAMHAEHLGECLAAG